MANIIDTWLDEHGDDELNSRVEKELKETDILYKIREYLFNTGVWNKELPDYNISEEYIKQTLEFLNTLENDNR